MRSTGFIVAVSTQPTASDVRAPECPQERATATANRLSVAAVGNPGAIAAADLGKAAESMESLPSVSVVVARLRAQGVDIPAGPVRVDAYGDSPELSASLLALIREGRKRAGTSLLWAIEAENEPVPQVGDVEVVVDDDNEPALITRITRVQVVPYNEVTAEYAATEGEGDGSLEYWREAHWAFFSRECKRIGCEPSETMPVVCSVFEVLNVLPPPA